MRKGFDLPSCPLLTVVKRVRDFPSPLCQLLGKESVFRKVHEWNCSQLQTISRVTVNKNIKKSGLVNINTFPCYCFKWSLISDIYQNLTILSLYKNLQWYITPSPSLYPIP